MKKNIYIIILLISCFSFGQVVIGDQTPVSLDKAILQINSTNENSAKALGLPIFETKANLPFYNPNSPTGTGYDEDLSSVGMLAYVREMKRTMNFTGKEWKIAFYEADGLNINITRAGLPKDVKFTCVIGINCDEYLPWTFKNESAEATEYGYYADYLQMGTEGSTDLISKAPGVYLATVSLDVDTGTTILNGDITITVKKNGGKISEANATPKSWFGGNSYFVTQQFVVYLGAKDKLNFQVSTEGIWSSLKIRKSNQTALTLEKIL